MAKVVTLGEIMLRLSPEGQDRFIQSESFRIIPGGGEANVLVSLSHLGHKTEFLTIPVNIAPEGYFYQPHYKIPLKLVESCTN